MEKAVVFSLEAAVFLKHFVLKSESEYEVCGILIGIDKYDFEVKDFFPCKNVHNDKLNHYEISREYIEHWEKHASENNLKVLGSAHNHPNGKCEFSKTDLELAFPYMLYVVEANKELKGFSLTNEGLKEYKVFWECPRDSCHWNFNQSCEECGHKSII